MSWNIIVFESERGEKPVEDFIKHQQPQTQAKISHLINLLERYGPMLGLPHVKKLVKNLYELRIRGKEEIRLFFAFRNKDIYLLHTFKKKSQKNPVKEIELASKRLRSINL